MTDNNFLKQELNNSLLEMMQLNHEHEKMKEIIISSSFLTVEQAQSIYHFYVHKKQEYQKKISEFKRELRAGK